MPYSKSAYAASAKYKAEKVKRIPLDVQKDFYDQIKAAADAAGQSVNGFIKSAISNCIIEPSVYRSSEDYFLWINAKATPEERMLFFKICGFSDWFNDLLFKNEEGPLPKDIEFFDYERFYYQVEPLNGVEGRFNSSTKTLTISPNFLDDDSVILHEMIHLHESVIEGLSGDEPKIYYDKALWSIYSNLKTRIPDLDDRINIELPMHIILHDEGGLHDLLFLLKSYDLDLRKGYPLGTVFGYGLNVEESPEKP